MHSHNHKPSAASLLAGFIITPSDQLALDAWRISPIPEPEPFYALCRTLKARKVVTPITPDNSCGYAFDTFPSPDRTPFTVRLLRPCVTRTDPNWFFLHAPDVPFGSILDIGAFHRTSSDLIPLRFLTSPAKLALGGLRHE